MVFVYGTVDRQVRIEFGSSEDGTNLVEGEDICDACTQAVIKPGNNTAAAAAVAAAAAASTT